MSLECASPRAVLAAPAGSLRVARAMADSKRSEDPTPEAYEDGRRGDALGAAAAGVRSRAGRRPQRQRPASGGAAPARSRRERALTLGGRRKCALTRRE